MTFRHSRNSGNFRGFRAGDSELNFERGYNDSRGIKNRAKKSLRTSCGANDWHLIEVGRRQRGARYWCSCYVGEWPRGCE